MTRLSEFKRGNIVKVNYGTEHPGYRAEITEVLERDRVYDYEVRRREPTYITVVMEEHVESESELERAIRKKRL